MNKFAVLLCLILFICESSTAEPRHWVLIVAGSRTYGNYRHQANVCHAYQLFRKNGIPEENIVLMSYDDAANSPENPYPGTLINKPGGPDVYKGCKIDYRGSQVNKDVFLSVLKGQRQQVEKLTGKKNAKVIASGREDNVFLTYSDHGAAGIVGMPTGDFLHESDLMEAVKYKHTHNQYKYFFMYIEACESGSMLPKLPTDINVFAVSSTNAVESGFACYYDNERETYLSDVYSAAWMEDTERGKVSSETFLDQFNVTYTRSTTGSNVAHPQKFGDIELADKTLDNFFVGPHSFRVTSENTNLNSIPFPVITDKIDVDMLQIDVLQKKLHKYHMKSLEHKMIVAKLTNEYRMKFAAEKFMKDLVSSIVSGYETVSVEDILMRNNTESLNTVCYIDAIRTITSICPGQINYRYFYMFRSFYVLSKLCNVAPRSTVLDGIKQVGLQNPICRRS